jgi:hypothetical protein
VICRKPPATISLCFAKPGPRWFFKQRGGAVSRLPGKDKTNGGKNEKILNAFCFGLCILRFVRFAFSRGEGVQEIEPARA